MTRKNKPAIIVRDFQLEGAQRKPIVGDIHEPTDAHGLVLFCHGFKGFKDWGFFNEIAIRFAQEGLVFAKFNFSHNGTSPLSPDRFTQAELFGENRYSYEMLDCERVVNFLRQESTYGALPIWIMGHSRGGGIALLYAAQNDFCQGVISWASVYDYKERFVSDLEAWKEAGVIYSHNKRTGQKLPLYYSFYEDYQENLEILDIPSWVRKLKKPGLLVHGTADEAVDFADVERLKAENESLEVLAIEGGNHTFGARHPKQDAFPEDLERVVKASIDFIQARR